MHQQWIILLFKQHDLVFIFGSDDFFHADYFKKCIRITRDPENNGITNDLVAFCNGPFDKTTRLGGIRIIDFKTGNSFILKRVNDCPKVRRSFKGYTSFSMGAFGFSRGALEKINYVLGSNEILFEQALFDAGIKKFIIQQLYYDVKDDLSVSTFNTYALQTANIGEMTMEEKQEYLDFMESVKHNLQLFHV
jgi:hypothetical protein